MTAQLRRVQAPSERLELVLCNVDMKLPCATSTYTPNIGTLFYFSVILFCYCSRKVSQRFKCLYTESILRRIACYLSTV